MTSDGGSPASAFNLLATIVADRTWERLTDNHGQPFATFTAFVEAAQPGGLGTTAKELDKLLQLRHPHEDGKSWSVKAPKLRRDVERLLKEQIAPVLPNGGDRRSAGFQLRGTKLVESDTAEHTVARLKRDDPTLAERVVSGEVSANAAAKEKGWRKPRVVLTSPEAVARKLREHFTAEQLAELIALLLGDSS